MRPHSSAYTLSWKILFTIVFVLSISEFLFTRLQAGHTPTPQLIGDERFDPNLMRLNSMKKLEGYVDSLQEESGYTDSAAFPLILSSVVRDRLYHGYLTYNLKDNFLAWLAGKLSGRSYDAIIEGDDILKYSEADCRQQCLVMMEALRKRGYPVRAVRMKTVKYQREHFTFEAHYDGSWHFFDPDLEPDAQLLLSRNRPPIASIAKDIPLMKSLYSKQDQPMIIDLLQSYQYGKVNELIPYRLYLFRSITMFLSNYAWLICLIFYFFLPGGFNFKSWHGSSRRYNPGYMPLYPRLT